MISYPISLPSSPGMVSVKPGATSIVGSSVGEFDGAVQRQWWGDLGFDFQCQLPPMTRNNAEAWAAALSALRSGYGTCYFGDPSGRIAQGAAGTGLVSGSSANGPNQAGSRTLAMKGMAPSTIALKAGDYFHHGAGDGSATRITTSGGSATTKYYYLGALSTNLQAYIVQVRIRVMGAKPVTINSNITGSAVVTVAAGTEQLVQLAVTGNGTDAVGLKFYASTSADALDFIVWDDKIYRVGYDENLIPASSRGFVSGWGAFGGATVTTSPGMGQRLYKVMQDATSDASGNAVVDVFPALRNAVTDGDALTFASPKGVFRLADPKAAWSINNALLYGMQFNLQEAIV